MPSSAKTDDIERILTVLEDHDVRSLFNRKLSDSGSRPGWPDSILAPLQRYSLIQAAHKASLEIELQSILARLKDVSICPIIFKGAALSYTHYPEPHLRPHADVDFLIAKDEIEPAATILDVAGYRRSTLIRSELVSNQLLFCATDRSRFSADLDFHWKISNRYLLSDSLRLDEIKSRAISIPAFGPWAKAPCPIHSLLLACLHRIGHHLESEQLIWLYDIHLIAAGLTEMEWKEFEDLATGKQVRAICRDGLQQASAAFGTPLSSFFGREAGPRGRDHKPEPSERYINSKIGRVHIFLLDFRDLPAGKKLRLLRELFFPSRDQLVKKYGISNRWLYPVLRLRRIGSIFRKLAGNITLNRR